MVRERVSDPDKPRLWISVPPTLRARRTDLFPSLLANCKARRPTYTRKIWARKNCHVSPAFPSSRSHHPVAAPDTRQQFQDRTQSQNWSLSPAITSRSSCLHKDQIFLTKSSTNKDHLPPQVLPGSIIPRGFRGYRYCKTGAEAPESLSLILDTETKSDRSVFGLFLVGLRGFLLRQPLLLFVEPPAEVARQNPLHGKKPRYFAVVHLGGRHRSETAENVKKRCISELELCSELKRQKRSQGLRQVTKGTRASDRTNMVMNKGHRHKGYSGTRTSLTAVTESP